MINKPIYLIYLADLNGNFDAPFGVFINKKDLTSHLKLKQDVFRETNVKYLVEEWTWHGRKIGYTFGRYLENYK